MFSFRRIANCNKLDLILSFIPQMSTEHVLSGRPHATTEDAQIKT